MSVKKSRIFTEITQHCRQPSFYLQKFLLHLLVRPVNVLNHSCSMSHGRNIAIIMVPYLQKFLLHLLVPPVNVLNHSCSRRALSQYCYRHDPSVLSTTAPRFHMSNVLLYRKLIMHQQRLCSICNTRHTNFTSC